MMVVPFALASPDEKSWTMEKSLEAAKKLYGK